MHIHIHRKHTLNYLEGMITENCSQIVQGEKSECVYGRERGEREGESKGHAELFFFTHNFSCLKLFQNENFKKEQEHYL